MRLSDIIRVKLFGRRRADEYTMKDVILAKMFGGAKPAPVLKGNFISMSNNNGFTVSIYNHIANWDGTMEYSLDGTTWTEWDGSAGIATQGRFYLRGTGNTTIVDKEDGETFVFSNYAEDDLITLAGDIDCLFDYQSVAQGEVPTKADYAALGLFFGCTAIVDAHDFALSKGALSRACFQNAFFECNNLKYGCQLPATVLSAGCYIGLYKSCPLLETLSAINTDDFPSKCCNAMYMNCSKIKISETETGEYVNAFRLPSVGTATALTNSFGSMLRNTGGTYVSTPAVNATYYTPNKIIYPATT